MEINPDIDLLAAYPNRTERRRLNRAAILSKGGGSCVYCGDKNPTTIDHVIPRSQKPNLEHYWGNQMPCCKQCNESKLHHPWLSWYRKQPFHDRNRERTLRAMLQEWGLE